MRSKFLCTLSLLAIASSLAVATTQVQFFDPSGNLITDASVIVSVREADNTAVTKSVLPPDADGTYDVPVTIGQKVTFELFNGAFTLNNTRELAVKIEANQGSPIPIVVTPQGAANDTCAGAQTVAIPSLTPDTTVGSTPDAAPTCGTSNTSAGVWFQLTGNGNTLTASTCETTPGGPGSATYDSKISVFCLDCATPTCVGGNDDVAGCNFHSAVTWCSELNSNYRILVHGFGAATGAFNLAISTGSTPCTGAISCTPPPPSGACCFTSECPYSQGEVPVSCGEAVTAEDCAAGGGTYQGDDTTCVIPVNQIDIVVTPGTPIPDNNPTGINSVINVGVSAIIADINVDIGINHTWVSDLFIEVTSPSGTTQGIWSQVCGSSDNINATADDEGTETFCAPIGAGPIDSVFYPPALAGEGPLSVFDGENALGNWTLNVSDNFAADLGTLNQWSLHIIEGAPVCPDVPCPGTGGGGGGGTGCDEDEDSDEDGDPHFVVESEMANRSNAPVGITEANGSTDGAAPDKGARSRGRLNR